MKKDQKTNTSTIEYQKKPLLFNQQIEKLIAGVSHAAEMGHVSSANKASFKNIVDILKDMKKNAKKDPALTSARKN